MKIILFLLASIFVAVYCESIVLTGKDFETTISSKDYVLAMFYAPWCGHCKTLKPLYDAAADKVEGKYVLAKIDCTNDNELCGKYEVKGYPTLLFFKNGNKKEYDGPRTTEGIIAWLDKHSGPIATHITSAKDLEEFVKNQPSAIGFFDSEESKEYKTFIAAAEDPNTQEMRFGYVTDSSLFGGNKDGSIKLYLDDKVGEDIDVPKDQAENAKSLANFLFDKTFPVLGEVGPENFKQYVNRKKPLFLGFIEHNKPTKEANVELLTKIAKKYPQFSFGHISSEKFGTNMERMGASGKIVPTVVRLSFTDNKPIAFDREGKFDEENINEWIEGIISGKYKYKLKSETEPQENDGPVKVIVGTTFDSIVHDKNKDVLVEFYAPWCGHCKNLVPEYEKLGTAFKSANDVVIAKIDLTANDVETSHHEVKGFPTILLYKRDDKEHPLEYKGARDAKSLASFIKENTKSTDAQSVNHDEL